MYGLLPGDETEISLETLQIRMPDDFGEITSKVSRVRFRFLPQI